MGIKMLRAGGCLKNWMACGKLLALWIFNYLVILVSVYYDTKQMMSRLGNRFFPPKEFLASELVRKALLNKF